MTGKICCCSLAGTAACIQCQTKTDCVLYLHYQSRIPFTWEHREPEYQTQIVTPMTKSVFQEQSLTEEGDDELVHPI